MNEVRKEGLGDIGELQDLVNYQSSLTHQKLPKGSEKLEHRFMHAGMDYALTVGSGVVPEKLHQLTPGSASKRLMVQELTPQREPH